MSNLEQQILDIIKAKPGQLAKSIAAQLKSDRRLINSILYGQLKNKVQQDKNYRWYLKEVINVGGQDNKKPQQLIFGMSFNMSFFFAQ